MTREEAIAFFKDMNECTYGNLEAVEMAIKALEQKPTTKNDLGVDCISRDAVKYYIQAHIHEIITESGIDKNSHTNGVLRALLNGVDTMPSVTPQEPQTFKWCTDCKEYDQEKHCCHRWSKTIRDTVEEMKQEYIEREVLDKIRAQIKSNLRGVEITLEVLVENDPLRPKMEGAKCTLEDCLELIDKAETEADNGNNNY